MICFLEHTVSYLDGVVIKLSGNSYLISNKLFLHFADPLTSQVDPRQGPAWGRRPSHCDVRHVSAPCCFFFKMEQKPRLLAFLYPVIVFPQQQSHMWRRHIVNNNKTMETNRRLCRTFSQMDEKESRYRKYQSEGTWRETLTWKKVAVINHKMTTMCHQTRRNESKSWLLPQQSPCRIFYIYLHWCFGPFDSTHRQFHKTPASSVSTPRFPNKIQVNTAGRSHGSKHMRRVREKPLHASEWTRGGTKPHLSRWELYVRRSGKQELLLF